VKADGVITNLEPFRVLFNKYQIHIQNEYFKYEYKESISIINFIIINRGKNPDYVNLFSEIEKMEPSTRSITLTNEINE
jgi:hypothetical protein